MKGRCILHYNRRINHWLHLRLSAVRKDSPPSWGLFIFRIKPLLDTKKLVFWDRFGILMETGLALVGRQFLQRKLSAGNKRA